MKRVNINRDVQSRQNIASHSATKTEKPIVEPKKVEEEHGKSEELQGSEDNTQDNQSIRQPQKRGRKTTGDA